MNKIKIFNDPIHGMVRFKHELLYDIIDHPVMQRLRRIKQMGMSNLVYPGANHTRFEHALGALHLMTRALNILKEKEVDISDEEYLASCIAILCHDIGHGPFSHALEFELIPISHEKISLILLKEIEKEMGKPINLAIKIFSGTYHKRFLCQLVSSQLDIDRLDYLTRDSFFTGVVEGKVGYDRLIMMLNVFNNELVIEEKGLSSVEKFLLSRRMMYSQVYQHKTSMAAEQMLKMFMKRCIKLVKSGTKIDANENILEIIKRSHISQINAYDTINQLFKEIDDIDIMETLKKNKKSCDQVLKILSQCMLDRNLFKVYLYHEKPSNDEVFALNRRLSALNNWTTDVTEELIVVVDDRFNTYTVENPIKILMKNGEIKEFSELNHFLPVEQKSKLFYIIAPKEELYNL